ncbi:MAG: ATP-binding protein [Bacteroidaceae bacterium]|nr:ATP-binding protein [Bacteroidaceae bacterium]
MTPSSHNSLASRSIVLTNDIREIHRLDVFIDDVCRTLHLDGATTFRLHLALEEAVANVINYAYPEGTRGEIHLRVSSDAGKLVFVITDQGIPFDPTSVDEPDITADADQRTIGGLGVFLMRQYMDKLQYENRDGLNILTLTKKLTA